uniref:PX domain-containing protein n=1 Tax=Bursaphelenchus xylophilus TaxID=6326 RepID=A0A1I7RZS9_BURXY
MVNDPNRIFDVEIIGHEIVDKHVEYHIQCTQSARNWTIKRRYRDFIQLKDELVPLGVELELPPKKFFGNTKEEFVSERQVKLQEFLRRVACHPFLFCSPTAAQFFELSEECLKNYENYILFAARNNPSYRLKRLWHACGWRYYKMHAELTDSEPHNDNDYVLTWMSYGPDSDGTDPRKRANLTCDALKFLKELPSNYFAKNLLASADERGVHTISNKLKKGNMRDFNFMVQPKDSFLKKYRLGTLNSVFNDNYMVKEIVHFTRQLIEIIKLFDSMDYPFYNFHCGNIVLAENGLISLMDYEFALTGHSNSDREALKRSKARTVQEMRIFHLGATIYEFLTGSITVPYPEDMDELYEHLPREFSKFWR